MSVVDAFGVEGMATTRKGKMGSEVFYSASLCPPVPAALRPHTYKYRLGVDGCKGNEREKAVLADEGRRRALLFRGGWGSASLSRPEVNFEDFLAFVGGGF